MTKELPYVPDPELRNFTKLITTRTTPPTWSANNVDAQIQIVTSGATSSLYIYDGTNARWLNVALVNGSL
jgi:hypothetical protein